MKLILILILSLGAIGALTSDPGDHLTDQQRLVIFDHCNQHPDAWDC